MYLEMLDLHYYAGDPCKYGKWAKVIIVRSGTGYDDSHGTTAEIEAQRLNIILRPYYGVSKLVSQIVMSSGNRSLILIHGYLPIHRPYSIPISTDPKDPIGSLSLNTLGLSRWVMNSKVHWARGYVFTQLSHDC